MEDSKECSLPEPDLEGILMKPISERKTRDVHKLALLHSWDEIVYRDCGSTLEYAQFKQLWRHNEKHRARLMENISIYKRQVRSSPMAPLPQYHSRQAVRPVYHKVNTKYSNNVSNNQHRHSGQYNQYNNGQCTNAVNAATHGSYQNHWNIQKMDRPQHNGYHGHSQSVYLKKQSVPNQQQQPAQVLSVPKLEWDKEVTERVYLSENSHHSADNMSFPSVTNEISSSVSVSSPTSASM